MWGRTLTPIKYLKRGDRSLSDHPFLDRGFLISGGYRGVCSFGTTGCVAGSVTQGIKSSIIYAFVYCSADSGSSNSRTPRPQEITIQQQVRPLPGKLDSVLVFNSNSPEVVQEEGILLSTLPPQAKKTPSAHLSVPFQGRFDVFAHHIAKARTPEDLRSLYLGILLHNPANNL